jgi:hypothetical protein
VLATDPHTIELQPGTHTFGTLVDPSFEFEVTPDGTVDYAPGPLDAFLSGRGTATLHVAGFEVAVDATALSLVQLWLQGASTGTRVASTRTTRSIPSGASRQLPLQHRRRPVLRLPDRAGRARSTTRADRWTASWTAGARPPRASTASFAITVDATPPSLRPSLARGPRRSRAGMTGRERVPFQAMNRRPKLHIVAPSASPEEAAAVVAALERFMRDTAPTRAPDPAGGPAPWARAGLLEGTGHDPGDPTAWG